MLEKRKVLINNLNSYPKRVEEEEPNKTKESRRKDIIKKRTEIIDIENRKTKKSIKQKAHSEK